MKNVGLDSVEGLASFQSMTFYSVLLECKIIGMLISFSRERENLSCPSSRCVRRVISTRL